jgi:hypothetical protein
MGVHRLSAKDFSNGALRLQLVDQCQKMNDLVIFYIYKIIVNQNHNPLGKKFLVKSG